jgi:hypothetical protein
MISAFGNQDEKLMSPLPYPARNSKAGRFMAQ